MKKRANFQWFMILALFASFLFSHPFASYAETDVTSKVQLTKSTLLYDRLKGTSYFDVYIKNISQDILLTPIRVVIESISPAGVTVPNADGTTSDGKPYFIYTLVTGVLSPNQAISNKRWIFSNPTRARFTYAVSVQGTIPEAAAPVGPSGGILEVTNQNSEIYGVKVEVPPDAIQGLGTVNIAISYKNTLPAPIDGNSVILSKVIELRKDVESSFQWPVKVTTPIATNLLKPGDVPGVLYWDTIKNKYRELGVKEVDLANGRVTFTTVHFTDVVSSAIQDMIEKIETGMMDIDTGFRPDVDGFFVKNKPTYYDNTNGECLGMSFFASWYYTDKKAQDGTGLYSKYRQGVYDDWTDDLIAKELIGRAHAASPQYLSSRVFEGDYKLGEVDTGVLLIQELNRTKSPLTLLLKISDKSIHAVTVYAYRDYKFYIYDNKRPGEEQILWWDPITGFWEKMGVPWPYIYIGKINKVGFISQSDALNPTEDFENLYSGAEQGFPYSAYARIIIDSPAPDQSGRAYVTQTENVVVEGRVEGGTRPSEGLRYFINGDKKQMTSFGLNPVPSATNRSFSFTIPKIDSAVTLLTMLSAEEPMTATTPEDWWAPYGAFREIQIILGQGAISGRVTAGEAGVQGVNVQISGPYQTQSKLTDGEGYYDFIGITSGSYTITPTRTGYQFNPPSRDGILYAPLLNQDFQALLYEVSGSIMMNGTPLEGVRMSLQGPQGHLIGTAVDGTYRFMIPENGNYVLTPSKEGYVFDPINIPINLSGANIPNQNFVATNTPPINLGLIAYYPFDGNADDASGNGNHGAVYGATLASDRFGNSDNAYAFDGVTSHIVVPDSAVFDCLTGVEDFSINLWVNFRSYQSDKHATFIEQYESNLNRWHWYYKDNSLKYGYHDDVQWNAITPVPWIPELNRWYNLTIVRGNKIFGIYVDGQLLSSGPFMAGEAILSPSAPIRIGFMEMENQGFDGKIDDIRIYNRALSEVEIQELYRPDLSNGLIAYYPFDGNANDASGNGNNGIEYNGVGYVSGLMGQATSFDGIDDFVRVPSSLKIQYPLTVSLWVKPSAQQRFGTFWSSDNRVAGATRYNIDDNKFYFYILTSDNPYSGNPASFPSIVDEWHHVVWLYDGDMLKGYVDGIEAVSVERTGSLLYGQFDDSTIGSYCSGVPCGSQNAFKGLVDEVRIYNRALSEAEILALYSFGQ